MRCNRLIRQPCSTKSLASHSSSSGWVGGSERTPKSLTRAHEPLSEMVLPDPVDDHAGDQRAGAVLDVGDPIRQSPALIRASLCGARFAGRFPVRLRSLAVRQNGNEPELHRLTTIVEVAAMEEPRRLRFGAEIAIAEHLVAWADLHDTSPAAVKRTHHPIIITRWDGVVFVVVAAGAAERQPQEARPDRGEHVVQLVVPFACPLFFHQLIRKLGERTGDKEPGRRHRLRVLRFVLVSRELPADEPIERETVIERADRRNRDSDTPAAGRGRSPDRRCRHNAPRPANAGPSARHNADS